MALSKAALAKRKRLGIVLIAGLLLATAAALVLNAFRDTVVFFYGPSEVIARSDDPALNLGERRFRLGGLVAEGTVQKLDGGRTTEFQVTDGGEAIRVSYTGLLPDLFREGQGVVAEGRLNGTLFVADSVLAKHDENYMPPEVADALKKSGYWQEDATPDGAKGAAAP